jgi:allantoinase
MALPDDYLQYPRRRYGMDHAYYAWSALPGRKKVAWPGGARVALWVSIVAEWFPLDAVAKPFLPPGGLDRAYPDFWNYTHRDYGNRVGIFRLFRMVEELGLKASVALNSALAERYPPLTAEIVRRRHEVIAQGIDMNHLHTGLVPVEQERAWIAQSLGTLEKLTGAKPRGWMSPAKSQSGNTLALLREAGVDYVCDWPNDDMPYPFAGPGEGLMSLPHSSELSDLWCIFQWKQTTDEYAEQLLDAFRVLYAEAATGGGRIMSVTLHPWISGQPHRVAPIREALERIARHGGVWPATGGEILDAFRAQKG